MGEDKLDWLAKVYSEDLMQARADGIKCFVKEIQKKQKSIEDFIGGWGTNLNHC